MCFQPTGKESLVEKWILHKLNIAAQDVNKHMAERNFMQVTTDVYNFWLYELCDVYIVGPISRRPVLNLTSPMLLGSDETHDG